MFSFSDVYTIIKDLVSAAKTAKNQTVLDLTMDLQEKFFELREDNDNLQQQIKQLKTEIEELSKVPDVENKIKYSPKGFFTIIDDNPHIPYCSCCWKNEHRLIPLSQYRSWFEYKCGNCRTDVVVMDENGKEIK